LNQSVRRIKFTVAYSTTLSSPSLSGCDSWPSSTAVAGALSIRQTQLCAAARSTGRLGCSLADYRSLHWASNDLTTTTTTMTTWCSLILIAAAVDDVIVPPNLISPTILCDLVASCVAPRQIARQYSKLMINAAILHLRRRRRPAIIMLSSSGAMICCRRRLMSLFRRSVHTEANKAIEW